jgi:hypothetical protein
LAQLLGGQSLEPSKSPIPEQELLGGPVPEPTGSPILELEREREPAAGLIPEQEPTASPILEQAPPEADLGKSSTTTRLL